MLMGSTALGCVNLRSVSLPSFITGHVRIGGFSLCDALHRGMVWYTTVFLSSFPSHPFFLHPMSVSCHGLATLDDDAAGKYRTRGKVGTRGYVGMLCYSFLFFLSFIRNTKDRELDERTKQNWRSGEA